MAHRRTIRRRGGDRTVNIAPPASISAAMAIEGPGRSSLPDQTEPKAQRMGATITRKVPAAVDWKSPSWARRNTPPNPRARPSHSRRTGHCPNRPAHNAAHRGITAMAVATRPDPTPRSSAMVTDPTPPTSSTPARAAALRHCFHVGTGIPRRRSHTYMRPPATTKRIAFIARGGKPSRPNLIPR